MSDAATRNPRLDRHTFTWVAASVIAALLPLAQTLPPWLMLLVAALVIVGTVSGLREKPISAWIRLPLTLGVAFAVLFAFEFRFGRDTGAALLVTMLALKLLETRRIRDARSVLSFALFAVMAGFLQDQSPLTLVLAVVATTLVLAALARVADVETPVTPGPVYFFNRYDRESVAQTWQVLRSEFDQMLLDNARARGAEVIEEITVKELLRENGRVAGVRALTKSGESVEYRAPITLDCSGKEAFAAVRNSWRMKDPYLNKVAVWTYYKGSKREPGIDEGATTVAFVPDKGWFWHIPQHNDMVSVGVVAGGKYLSRDGVREPEAMFKREIEQNAWIKDHLSLGEQVGPYFITSEYTHHARHCGSDGLLLVGDAFAFLDPVFSSGLMLALKSGTLAGEAVHQAILDGDFSPARFAAYGRYMREGVENMRKLVYAFYNPDFSFKKVIEKYPEAGGEITDCLSGDVNKDFTPLWTKFREFVPLPEDLPVGEPLIADAVSRQPSNPPVAAG